MEIRKSSIEGQGVFAKANISRGTIVWQFTGGHDKMMTIEEFQQLDKKERKEMENTGYLSPLSNRWIFPPQNDPARFTNHSRDNNLTAVFNQRVSDEPYFIANRNIREGEELTNNYYEFDKVTQKIKPKWA